jgi:hypothetical protein
MITFSEYLKIAGLLLVSAGAICLLLAAVELAFEWGRHYFRRLHGNQYLRPRDWDRYRFK